MAYYLGIDLGTTYTAAAAERDGVVESLTLGNRTASVPSVVFLRDDGEILVGEAATRRATTDPGRVAREFKRRVGDPTPIILGGTPYAAEMLMARLLHWSVERVREQQGEPPRAIALTHPANWGPYKLDLFNQAVRQVDLDAALLLAEPVAAATFYASQRKLAPGSVVAVYDLGGGTFDAAMVRRNAHGFEIIGSPEGMERLGGIDFDEAVFAHVRDAVGEGIDRLDPDEPAAQAAVARLRQECIDAKEALSSDTDVSIPVLLPGLQTEVRLTRTEFEAMIRPAISETIVALRRAIRSANVENDEISAVLLVGGSSRIPLVAQMVGAELGRPIAIDAHPKDAISFGAAIAVAERRGAATPESVTTVLADKRPPPPTVSSDATRRPAPPGAAGARPPAPGQRTARPAPPPPGAQGARPPAPGASRPAAPAAAGMASAPPGSSRPAPSPGQPGGATPPGGRPGAPGASPAGRPSAPGASPAGRPAAPGASPTGRPAAPGSTVAGRPTPPGGSPGGAGAGAGAPPVGRPAASATPAGGTPPPARPGPPPGNRPAATGGAPGVRTPTSFGAGAGPTSGGYAAAGNRPGAAAPQPFSGMPRAGGTPMGGHSSGSFAATTGSRVSNAADNRNVWIALAVIAAVAIIAILVVTLSGDDGDPETGGGSGSGGGSGEGYTEANEAAFLSQCTSAAGDGSQAQCECAWEQITETISYDRFLEIEEQLASGDGSVPEELATIVADCMGAS